MDRPALPQGPGRIMHTSVCMSPTLGSTVLAGVQVRCLPRLGVGHDYVSHEHGAEITTRLWESPRRDGWGIDAIVTVARHPNLTDERSAARWMIGWQDRPRSQAHYREVQVTGRRAWLANDEVIFMVRPGVVVSVRIDPSVQPGAGLTRIAGAARAYGDRR